MTTTNEPQDPRQLAGADRPCDIPAGRPAALSRLDAPWGAGDGSFLQRYTGVFSDDGRTIKGAWEGSAEGSQWKHDFDLNYARPELAPAAIQQQRRGDYGPVD